MRPPINSFGATIGVLLALPGLASAQTAITVGLPTSPPNVVHMPVIIAQELGLYKKYGIDVKTVSLPGGVHVFRAVLSGNADVGLSPASVTLVARSKGLAHGRAPAHPPVVEPGLAAEAVVPAEAPLASAAVLPLTRHRSA